MSGLEAIQNRLPTKLDKRGLFPSDKRTTKPFDPSGSGFDINSALDAGMTRQSEPGPNFGHFGSVVPTTPKQRQDFNLPENSYMILKGRQHKTYNKAVQGEINRGFKVLRRGSRDFSVPAKIGDILDE
jgi:hypothetical protein